MASQNIIMPPMRCRCCLPCCSWPQLCVVCLLWDFDLHRPPPNPVPALHSCPHLTGGIETEKLARGTLHFKHLWRLMDGSCQFIASLTNTIFSLSLTKRTERSLSLHNALQLDFYLLPDFRVNLVVPKFQNLPNRTDWHTTCFSQNRLNQQHVYLVHFSFFLPSLILLAVFVTEAQFPVLLHTAVSMCVWEDMTFIIALDHYIVCHWWGMLERSWAALCQHVDTSFSSRPIVKQSQVIE